jgi:hypothetical protein
LLNHEQFAKLTRDILRRKNKIETDFYKLDRFVL